MVYAPTAHNRTVYASLLMILGIIGIKIYSQEREIYMLNSGFVSPVSYKTDGIEQLEYINYMEITSRENGFYEIKINYKHNGKNEYWTFKIENITTYENYIKGQLSNITLEGTEGTTYFDENAIGKIEIKKENNLINIEIIFYVYKNERNNIITFIN
ncbi:MAG: hypothetical protein LBJ63_05860 [Prevotellaceae bacterium]|jgi:hypothetical protein|nr:hypothetical protein [Prevotellaceae bacterium]